MTQNKILLIGANGQIGSVLTSALRSKYGKDQVISTDIREPESDTGPFEILDVTNTEGLRDCISRHQPDHVYHLAALLSAKGEQNPALTWKINFGGLINVLDAVRDLKVSRLFFPSSIAVFGKTTPRIRTPQDSPLLPETVYGISKVTGENWCNYYHEKYGVDVRSIRYPGIIGHQSIPEGGTTDYAVEIFHAAIKEKKYTCFLDEHTRLPMMYMEDAVRATIEIMEADSSSISLRYGYNLGGIDFTPAEIAAEIQKHIPDFSIEYQPDFRQAIAESWSESIDDDMARKDWGWEPKFDLESLSKDMIKNIKLKY